MIQSFSKRLIVAAACAALMCVQIALSGESERDKGNGLQKTNTSDLYRPFLINQVFNYYGNNGDGSYNKFSSDNEGFEFPKGTPKHTVIFEDGVVWGGFHKGRATPKVGGSVYRHGLVAGKILTPGTPTTDPIPDDASLAKYRIYRVRPDINPHKTFAQVKDLIDNTELPYIIRFEQYSDQDIYNQYVQDWNEWPAADGAPYEDVNADGVYDPSVDIPGQPGADQTLWYVSNDCNTSVTFNLAGSPVIGLEMQRTIWGYNRTGALGSTVFESTKLINKSGAPIDTMFLVQWSDPDLGDATDDFTGCDTTAPTGGGTPRNLGYIYNGKPFDAFFNSQAVPAGGFAFFQGPIIPTGNPQDSAVFQLKYRHGYKNLRMTTFDFFINGNATYTDPIQGAGGDVQWYRLMQGTVSTSGGPFIDPTTGQATKFTLAGDPVTATGWIDGTIAPPGDRRLCIVTGPFTMANGDTQEIVVGNLAGLGSNRISSISVLRYNNDIAQAAYNNLFNLPNPPPLQQIKITQLDGEILLSWADTSEARVTENWVSRGYKFEGYNVYQFPGPSTDNPIRAATYDLVNTITLINDFAFDVGSGTVLFKPVQFGGDFGIARYFDTKTDAVTSGSLVNGNKYYFSVTAYSYNPDPAAKPNNLETAFQLLIGPGQTLGVVPQSPNPGNRYVATGTGVPVTHATGISTAIPTLAIANPTALLPHNYQAEVIVTDSVYVYLDPEDSTNRLLVPNPRWRVRDLTTSTLASNTSLVYGPFDKSATIIQGFQFALDGAPYYVPGKSLGGQTFTSGINFTGVNAGLSDGGSGRFNGSIAPGDGFFGGLIPPQDINSDFEVDFVGSGQGQNAYDFVRQIGGGSSGAPYYGFFPQPFNVYELNPDGTRRRQVDFAFMEALDFAPNPSTYDSVWAPGPASGNREYWFVIGEDYTSTAKAKYTNPGPSTGIHLGAALGQDSVLWGGWYTKRDTSSSVPAYTAGDKWILHATKFVTPNDTWTFSMANFAPTYSTTTAQQDVSRINVFPNPYIGFNPQELNKFNRFVTINHLPPKATIRVFNLAGVLVRTIMKDNAQIDQATWDLNNQSGFPVAAGMYIIFVDMPDLGQTKTLKLAVVPETQYLDRY